MNMRQPDGYLAQPTVPNGKAVMVLHAWWGLNETIKNFCRRLAAKGFVVFAPDLYHGKIADTIPAAEKLSSKLDADPLKASEEILHAASFLNAQAGQPSQGLAVIGFSLGAYFALELSNAVPELIRKVVLFYGSGPVDFERSQAEYLAHFAGNDPYEPQSSANDLQALLVEAGRPATFYTYPGTGHWFFESDREDAYQPKAAELAWERTLAFLEK